MTYIQKSILSIAWGITMVYSLVKLGVYFPKRFKNILKRIMRPKSMLYYASILSG